MRLLDVACGTGAMARHALSRVEPGGSVAGLDINPPMLTVARRLAPQIDWQEGSAESLPWTDGTFDVVTCQFGLMFFADQVTALREMWRVLRPGGQLALTVWDELAHSPGFAAMVDLLDRSAGTEAAAALRAPFSLGRPESIRQLFETAGIDPIEIATLPGEARFPSIDDYVTTEVRGWTLSEVISDEAFARLAGEARTALASFEQADRTLSFPAPAHLVLAQRHG
jgi:ubiquinone/menaquinone biosynthesis C-methylase UbiE